MILRMQQNGDFKDQTAGSDIVTKIYELEKSLTQRSGTEANVRIQQLDGNVLQNEQDEAERRMILQI